MFYVCSQSLCFLLVSLSDHPLFFFLLVLSPALQIYELCNILILVIFFLQIEDETQVSRATQAEQDHYEMHVRAANIVSMNTWHNDPEYNECTLSLMLKP